AKRQQIAWQDVKGGGEIPQLEAVVIGSGRKTVRSRLIGEIAARICDALSSKRPCQMIVTEPDSVCKRRSKHIFLAPWERIDPVPLSSEMIVEAQCHF